MRRKVYHPKLDIVQSVEEKMRAILQQTLRNYVLKMVYNLLQQEVLALCGSPFSHKGKGACHRAGSDPSSVLVHGQRVKIKKPRVRRDNQEVKLSTHKALRNYDVLNERVIQHMLSGVSSRDYEPLLEELSGGLGLKKSTVSRSFVKASRGQLDQLNSRDLSSLSLVSIMLDGVSFGDVTVIVALGIDERGRKHILGIRQAETENWQACRDLLESLIDRGLSSENSYLFVIDGSKALKKAIRRVFSKSSPIQRCVQHKRRNILKYLPQERHGEFNRRWKKLHGLTVFQDVLREYESLRNWLGGISYSAQTSLEESEKETLTTVRLGLPLLLRKTLSSTNPIESAFSIVKPRVSRVRNWRSGTDQVARWSASVLLSAERRFRTIKGYREIPILIKALKKITVENKGKVA